MDITHDNVCSSMLSCFYSRLLSTGRPISSFFKLKSFILLFMARLICAKVTASYKQDVAGVLLFSLCLNVYVACL